MFHRGNYILSVLVALLLALPAPAAFLAESVCVEETTLGISEALSGQVEQRRRPSAVPVKRWDRPDFPSSRCRLVDGIDRDIPCPVRLHVWCCVWRE